jgi:hypothetical protein
MTNFLSKLIPKKPSRLSTKSYAKPIIPLYPRATWVPEKSENAAGEKSRSLKLELSTEPGNKDGKTLTKSFKIFRSGSPEEWILWRTDYNEVCVGMSITLGAARNRMVRQMLSDEPLKEFERTLSTFATETTANSNRALDAVAATIFPTNAYAKQKKYLRQGMWKPRAISIRNTYTRICELNDQLSSYPNQTGLLPDDELKSAFINLCSPDWQQEFLKTDINEYSSSWPDILAKAEALEQAEAAIAEYAPAKDPKRDHEDGEISTNKPPLKKKAKTAFYCKMHGPDQRHNTDGCKVINAEIERLKGRKPLFNNNQRELTDNVKKPWTENKKRPAASYSIEQLKEIVRMTRKKATADAKTKFETQAQDELHLMETDNDNLREKKLYNDAIQELDKMRTMEVYINNPIDEEESDIDIDDDLTQAELDELAASFSD